MKIIIKNTKKLADLKQEFNRFFPFLTLEFFENTHSTKITVMENLTIGRYRREDETGILNIFPEMSVADLEKILLNHFKLPVQVLRKSGSVWLRTTHTEAWSLERQNSLGEIVSAELDKNEHQRG